MATEKKANPLEKLDEGDRLEKALTGFQETLLDFCESVLSNGSQRGDEWDCADLQNSPLTEGSRGSCSVNLSKGVFYDNNPTADPQSGGMLDMWIAIFGGSKRKAVTGMEKWNADRTLPDGTKGVASGKRVELSGGVSIQAMDEFEQGRISWIKTFQNWTAWAEKRGVPYADLPPEQGTVWFGDRRARDIDRDEYVAEQKKNNDDLIAWAISDIYSRRWLLAVECTQVVRDKFADELAEYRGLSKEVFLWLVDNGHIACVYERKEIKQEPVTNEDGEEEQPPPKVLEFFNIAFPVYREVTPDMVVPHWVGNRKLEGSGTPEEMAKPKPTILFHGMHIRWIDRDGHKHWRYDPKGCPSYPWITGDVSKADLVVVAESTWDIIAYIDLRKLHIWKRPWCAIATRGASNAARIPADKFKEGAVVVRLLQNDAGNAAWVTNLPSMPAVKHREIKPPEGIKDLNDWMREAGAENVLKAIW